MYQRVFSSLTLLAALMVTSPLLAQTSTTPNEARYGTSFDMVRTDGGMLEGAAETPTAARCSFAVYQSLSEGLGIRLSSHLRDADIYDYVGPYPTNSIIAWVYEDFNLVGNYVLDGAFAQLATTGEPVPMNPGMVAVIPHAFEAGKYYTVAVGPASNPSLELIADWGRLRWCFDGDCANQKVTNTPFIKAPSVGIAAVKHSTFYYGRDTLNLSWLSQRPGIYQPWNPDNSFPADTIATNYDAAIVVNTGQVASAPNVISLTAHFYHDTVNVGAYTLEAMDGDDSTPEDHVLESRTFTLNGEGTFDVPLMDLRNTPLEGTDGFYWLDIELTNEIGSTVKLSDTGGAIPIGSYRQLETPQRINWELVTTANGCITAFNTERDFANDKNINYLKPDPSCISGSQHIYFRLLAFSYDQDTFINPNENMDLSFDIGMLNGREGGCDEPNFNFISVPTGSQYQTGSSPSLDFVFENWELIHSGSRNRWRLKPLSGYPGGDFVEMALLKIKDERSGKEARNPASDFNSWISDLPRQRIRLYNVSGQCPETYAIDFMDPVTGASITTADHQNGSGVRFDQMHTYANNPIVTPSYIEWSAHTLEGTEIPKSKFTIKNDALGNEVPLSDTPYELWIELNDNAGIEADFRLFFRALKHHDGRSVSLATNSILIHYTPDTGGGGGGGGGTTYAITAVNPTNMHVNEDNSTSMSFGLQHTPADPSSLQWRWKRQVAGTWEYFEDPGTWGSNDTWYQLLTLFTINTRFHGTWLFTSDASSYVNYAVSQDFSRYAEAFFGTFGTSQEVSVDLRMTWPDDSTAEWTQDFTVTRTLQSGSIESLLARKNSVDSGYAPFNLLSSEAAQLELLVSGEDLNANDLSILHEGITYSPDHHEVLPTFIRLYFDAQTTNPLIAALARQGQHQLTVSTGDGQSFRSINLHVREPQYALKVRYHFKDHLGSSAITQSYRSLPPTQNSEPDDDDSLVANGVTVQLYDYGPTVSFFSPFGDPLEDTNVAGENVDARYTDHERDTTTGFNYMKGRYQLASMATFNRPDPKRDWDWQNPNSLNLYQYVRNNPINTSDPDGFNAGVDLRFRLKLKRDQGFTEPNPMTRSLDGVHSYGRGIARGFQHAASLGPRTDQVNYILGLSLYATLHNTSVVDRNGKPIKTNEKPIKSRELVKDRIIEKATNDTGFVVGRLGTGAGLGSTLSIASKSVPFNPIAGVGISISLNALALAGDLTHAIDAALTKLEKNDVDIKEILEGVKYDPKANTLTVDNPLFISEILQPTIDAILGSSEKPKNEVENAFEDKGAEYR